MIIKIFFTVIRSVVIPFLAVYLLTHFLSFAESTALVIVGTALLITTIISIVWSIVKILGNTLLLRGKAILTIVIQIAIQIAALFVIWYHYFDLYTDIDLPIF